MRAAFQQYFQGYAPEDWADLDVTEIYQATRRIVFETCERVEVVAKPGQAILLDRHLVHGVATLGQRSFRSDAHDCILPAAKFPLLLGSNL